LGCCLTWPFAAYLKDINIVSFEKASGISTQCKYQGDDNATWASAPYNDSYWGQVKVAKTEELLMFHHVVDGTDE